MLEIEIKVKVESVKPIRSKIKELGGEFSEKLNECDQYYNAPHRDFGETDEALRMRQTENGVTVTYKGPKETILGSKVREEVNLPVKSAENFDAIITKLGFFRVATVKKEREYWHYEDFSVALDNVENLGDFVEIELVSENDAKSAAQRVDKVAKKLGVEGERITTSYLELLLS